jgi:predicted enzyme related to lactoylglutathione lyase
VEILTSRILLHPADLDRSLRFYERTIGLAIYREWGTGPSRGVVFFLGGGLLEVSGGSPQPPSSAVELVLQVRDLAATREHLAERGVVAEAEPELKPWGLF